MKMVMIWSIILDCQLKMRLVRFFIRCIDYSLSWHVKLSLLSLNVACFYHFIVTGRTMCFFSMSFLLDKIHFLKV